MYKEYIVTGAAGFLGSAVVRELLCRGVKAENIRALALENEKLPSDLPESVVWVRGDVTDDGSLGGLFGYTGRVATGGQSAVDKALRASGNEELSALYHVGTEEEDEKAMQMQQARARYAA